MSDSNVQQMAMMRRLAGPFWWANRIKFLQPGLYFCTDKFNQRILPIPRPCEPPALVDFPEVNHYIAKDQPEYRTMPANVKGPTVTCCWQLNWRQRIKILITGKIWHQILSPGPLQPQLLLIDKPDLDS